MSASLVGSEMCIRDRSSSRVPRGVVDPGAYLLLRWSAASRRRAREEPVSYTHLTLPTICSV
eukprot:2750097-Alexandrium_andersonii.AAC.1